MILHLSCVNVPLFCITLTIAKQINVNMHFCVLLIQW